MPSKLRTSGKKKQPASTLTSEDIAAATAEFLRQGGKIERIRSGVSGQDDGRKAAGKAAR